MSPRHLLLAGEHRRWLGDERRWAVMSLELLWLLPAVEPRGEQP